MSNWYVVKRIYSLALFVTLQRYDENLNDVDWRLRKFFFFSFRVQGSLTTRNWLSV